MNKRPEWDRLKEGPSDRMKESVDESYSTRAIGLRPNMVFNNFIADEGKLPNSVGIPAEAGFLLGACITLFKVIRLTSFDLVFPDARENQTCCNQKSYIQI